VISASNNGGRGSSFPKNPGRSPYTINVEGWYTFEHRFRDGGGGVLAVDSDDQEFCRRSIDDMDPERSLRRDRRDRRGNRYGWFVQNEFPFLGFDTSMLIGFQDFCVVPPSTAGAKVTAGGWITVLTDKGTFGLTAKANGGTSSGNVTYQDHGVLARTVKSTEVTSVTAHSRGPMRPYSWQREGQPDPRLRIPGGRLRQRRAW
jgi:hypothetical protein